jgi:decaprenylphospho-beta-D-ribofuranose 2-oxidase
VIVGVRVRLLRVGSPMMLVATERAADLDDVLAQLAGTDHLYRYSVAWIDCAGDGARFGRGLLMRGDHASAEEAASAPVEDGLGRPRLRAPARVSLAPLIRNTTTRAFNELYYRRASARAESLQTPGSFFFPLDQVADWNRLYGGAGFLQYQFVLPFGAEAALREILVLLSTGRRRPTLVVLKRFGRAERLLSFPAPGRTVACDLPLPAPGLAQRLDRADALVAAHGGRVYLAKDSRMRPEFVAPMYPGLDRWREVRGRLDPERRMQSDLARRLVLEAGAGGGAG